MLLFAVAKGVLNGGWKCLQIMQRMKGDFMRMQVKSWTPIKMLCFHQIVPIAFSVSKRVLCLYKQRQTQKAYENKKTHKMF